MSKKKKDSIVAKQEPTLYDLEAAQETSFPNGTAPTRPAVQYIETQDEAELRSLIFQTSDVVEELLDIPEWHTKDGKVFQILIRALNARERAQFVQSQAGKTDMAKGYGDIMIMACRHPVTKKLLFQPGDRDELLKKQGRVVERIAFRVSQLSGLSEEDMSSMKKN